MATDLAEYVESMKRRVIPPGSTVFSNVSEEEWANRIADGFWEARLDGFVEGFSADAEGFVSPDLPRDLVALAILYAAIGVMQTQVLNSQTRFSAKAGPVSIETETSATVYRTMLESLLAQRDRLLDELDEGQDVTPVYITDAYTVRSSASYSSAVDGLWDDLGLLAY